MKFSTAISLALVFAATASAGVVGTTTVTAPKTVTITDTDCEQLGTECTKHKSTPTSTSTTAPTSTPTSTPTTTPSTTSTSTSVITGVISIPGVSQETPESEEGPGYTILPLAVSENGNLSFATNRTPPVSTYIAAGSANTFQNGAFALAAAAAIAFIM